MTKTEAVISGVLLTAGMLIIGAKIAEDYSQSKARHLQAELREAVQRHEQAANAYVEQARKLYERRVMLELQLAGPDAALAEGWRDKFWDEIYSFNGYEVKDSTD